MNLKPLTADLSVSPQITPEEVAKLAAAGYRSIISNRPDGESPDQPAWLTIKAAAAGQGMEALHIPVVASQISDADVESFREALKLLPKPVAAFCRTGTRAALLWALANEAKLSLDERMRIAGDQGYDLSPFRPRLQAADAKLPE